VVDANARARAEGVGPGLTDAEAIVRCPSLVRRPASPEAEAAARHALLEACLAVSPRLEDAAPGEVYVDLAGLERLFGGDLDVGGRLRRHARAVGLEARVGIAATRVAAGVAARVGLPVNALPVGGERAALAGVPLAVLPWPPGLAAAFARWGLVTLGDLARLPPPAWIASRSAPGHRRRSGRRPRASTGRSSRYRRWCPSSHVCWSGSAHG
jgi:protein ImuB